LESDFAFLRGIFFCEASCGGLLAGLSLASFGPLAPQAFAPQEAPRKEPSSDIRSLLDPPRALLSIFLSFFLSCQLIETLRASRDQQQSHMKNMRIHCSLSLAQPTAVSVYAYNFMYMYYAFVLCIYVYIHI